MTKEELELWERYADTALAALLEVSGGTPHNDRFFELIGEESARAATSMIKARREALRDFESDGMEKGDEP